MFIQPYFKYVISFQLVCSLLFNILFLILTPAICPTPCSNGGTCIKPDTCECPTSHDGEYCQTLLCSHLSPCFPGTCSYPDNCACLRGFGDPDSGCLAFTSDNNYPVINDCELTLANIRRQDEKELFYYNHPCSYEKGKDTVWSNQGLFNYAKFTIKSQYHPTEYIPPPPSYVSEYRFGIVETKIRVEHSKYQRNGGGRFVAQDRVDTCPELSSTLPETEISDCSIVEESYNINTEHNDKFTVTYSTTSGGYRKLYDIVNRRYYKTETYIGRTTEKVIEFRFDFIEPVHCSEQNASVQCTRANEQPIYIDADITHDPIKLRWSGWSDDLSGITYYYLEIFELKPNIHEDLTELQPLNPIFNKTLKQEDTIIFRPKKSGMYSILLQASDRGNNSKIARRLVLYDNESNITLTKSGFLARKPIDVTELSIGDGGMYVTSAIPETGYLWQSSKQGTKTHIVLDWKDHFVNKLHRNGKLLNKVIPYPTQFAELQENAVLRNKKYVALDDNEGSRTTNRIPNVNGVVKFEIKRVYTDDREEPTRGWEPHSLTERYEIRQDLVDGSHVRLWVRATDIMNNTLADYTEVHIDNTGPRVANERLQLNIDNMPYTYTSRITFRASDDDSGVHKLDFKLYFEGGRELYRQENVMANKNNASNACDIDPNCICVLNTCFLREQTIDIDNCWFLVPQKNVNESAYIAVNVYNQALLRRELIFNISRLSSLNGLDTHSRPTNIRVEGNFATGVRLIWDLPNTASCYGNADSIQVILISPDGSTREVNVHNDDTFVELVGLEPDQTYSGSINLRYHGNELTAIPFMFKTAPKETHLPIWEIVGIAVSVLIIIAILIAVIVVLVRRRQMKPVQRESVDMSVEYRKSEAGSETQTKRRVYDEPKEDADSLYLYGVTYLEDIETWKYKREDVKLGKLLKAGRFANIYLAKWRKKRPSVVAKTLKEGYTHQDELLMKEKINFCSMQLGHHKSILRFEGAVVSGSEIGPFIIYEYCSKGQLDEFLPTLEKQNTTESFETLLRFGLEIVKGMEYLAQKRLCIDVWLHATYY